MEQFGFYVIDDDFFKRFNDPYLKGNKSENRPHYYCFQDNNNGLYWVIPMSSRIDKYKQIIERQQKQHKPCDKLHICKLSNDKENVFLIQDMFPVTENYIKRPYTFANKPLILISESERRIINQKALRILNLIEHNIRFSPLQVDALKIKNALLLDLSRDKNKELTTV
ncbi:MAG: hypothetical protein K2F81_02970 [Ruminococcus sp.]|nr:hypothetical protein [Ruminococcus sp.]